MFNKILMDGWIQQLTGGEVAGDSSVNPEDPLHRYFSNNKVGYNSRIRAEERLANEILRDRYRGR
jgi:hypothetical protein